MSTQEKDPNGSVTSTDPDGPSPPATGDAAPVPFTPTLSFVLAFSSLMMLCLAVSLDATTLSVALPEMSTDLGGTALQAFWSGTGFLLASSVFQPVFASFSSIFGRSYLIYVASLIFAVGSLVAALAKSFTVVVIGRAVQGAGGGGLLALTEVVVTDLVPLSERGKYFSILSAIWSVGTVTGPLIGAGFAQDVTWRWIFWMNLPIIAVGVIMVFFFLKQQRIPGDVLGKLKKFDFMGGFLFVVGSTSFLFGVSSGGVMYDWDSWQTLVSILVGAAVMVVFGFWEVMFAGRFGTEPLINRGIFSNWSIMSVYIQAVLHGALLWSLLYFLVLYYQGVQLYSPVTSAVAVLPETLTVAPAAVAVGIASAIMGRYRWALWTGWIIGTLGTGLLYLLDRNSSVAQWIFLNLPVGIGTGMIFPAAGLGIQAASPPHLNADAAAFFSFLRTFGQSIGVAVSGTIFQNAFRSQLEDLALYAPRAEQLSREATTVVGLIKGMPDGEPKEALMDAYNEGLRIVWIALTALAGVSLLLSFTVKGYSLQQKHVSKQKLVAAEKAADEERTGKK